MKIAIIGAGAMGCLYGAKLSTVESNEVFLIDIRQDYIDAINTEGIFVEENGVVFNYKRVVGSTDPNKIGPVDLAVIFVKSTETAEAASGTRAIFGKDTIALTLQNGLGNLDILCERMDKRNIIAGTTAHGAYMIGPGRVCHAGYGKTVIGDPYESKDRRLNGICGLFNAAGIETAVSDNVLGLIWDKLLVNVGINALTALTELLNGQLLCYPEIESILEEAVNEAWLVAKAKGINLGFTDPVAHTKEICRSTALNRSSMLQDILLKRKTEIDMINGAIVREGGALGISTPVNMVLANLVKFKEQSQKEGN